MPVGEHRLDLVGQQELACIGCPFGLHQDVHRTGQGVDGVTALQSGDDAIRTQASDQDLCFEPGADRRERHQRRGRHAKRVARQVVAGPRPPSALR